MPSKVRMLAGALALSSAMALNCSNPVFSNRMFGAPGLDLVVGAPQPHPAAAKGDPALPCSAFANKDSCCTNETLQQINYYFQMGDELLNQTGMLIQNNDYPSKLEALVTAQMELICTSINENYFPTLAADCRKAESILTTYTDKLSQAAQDVVEAELKCAQGLSNYFKGVLCFACEADWDKYLVRDIDEAITGLNLNEDTCDSIVRECEPVNDAVIKVATTAVDFADAMLTEFTGGLWPALNVNLDDLVNDLPDSCGGTMGSPGDCKTFYCESGAVSGMLTPTQSNWGWNTVTEAHTRQLTVAQRRALEAVAATTSSSVNVYTSNGYDAYRVGAADVPSGLQPWAVALIAVAAVAVVATVVAVVVVRRSRGVSRSVQYSTRTSVSAQPPSATNAVTAGAYGSFKDEGSDSA
eukprot:INCI15222.1.p1 GENE.INCI15222.1~~INCI15222.1.p1  ORF type:complete len:412 (-),score=73.88 INCI15222.1:413-1648(-)